MYVDWLCSSLKRRILPDSRHQSNCKAVEKVLERGCLLLSPLKETQAQDATSSSGLLDLFHSPPLLMFFSSADLFWGLKTCEGFNFVVCCFYYVILLNFSYCADLSRFGGETDHTGRDLTVRAERRVSASNHNSAAYYLKMLNDSKIGDRQRTDPNSLDILIGESVFYFHVWWQSVE